MDECRDRGLKYGYYVDTLGPRLSPRMLYRVWTDDGHEELVRGAIFNELDTRALRSDLVAAGDDPLVSNRTGVPFMTIVSPSVLFDELEVKRADNTKEKLPDYPAPALTFWSQHRRSADCAGSSDCRAKFELTLRIFAKCNCRICGPAKIPSSQRK